MKAYFISGLGADREVFKNLDLPASLEPVYLDWLKPAAGETLCSYADRLSEFIDASEPFILIGLSFGGMLATEIARKKIPGQLVLISSVPCRQHLPWYYTIAGRLRLHRLIPVGFLKQASLLKRLFTTETAEDKILLRKMIRRSDPQFIKWALGAIVNWPAAPPPVPLLHIHGTADFILPVKCTRPTHVIRKGGHLMIMNRADEISRILAKYLH